MPRVHVELNAPATNHRWRVNHTYNIPNSTLFQERRFENFAVVELGTVYPLSGFKFGILTVQNPSIEGGIVAHALIFDWPSRNITNLIYLTSTPSEVIVEGDSFEMVGTDCLGWVFDCGDVRVYVDGNLALTVAGPYTDSGDIYDARYNQCTMYSYTNGADIWRGYRKEDCSPGRGWEPLDRTESLSASCLGGWQWDNAGSWQAETTQVDGGMTVLTPPVPSWCPASLGCTTTPSSVSGVTTWTMTCGSEYYLRSHYFLDSIGECLCDIRGGGQTIIPVIRWRHQGETRHKSALVSTTPTFAGLLDTRRTKLSCQGCYADITECNDYEAITLEASTWCHHSQTFVRGTVDDFCSYYPGGVCPDGTTPCSPDLSTFCYFMGNLSLWWESLCGGSCCATLDIAPNGRMYTAYLLTATNAVIAGYASTGFMSDGSAIAWQVFDAGFTADALNIRYDRCGADPLLWLVYESGGTIYRRSSANHGETWSVATSIASGANPTHDPIESGLRYVYWRDGTALKGQIFDTEWNTVVSAFTATGVTLDSDSTVEAKVHGGGAGQLVIVVTYKDGGNVKYAYSRDGQAFS